LETVLIKANARTDRAGRQAEDKMELIGAFCDYENTPKK
jgi:hypothetical protein